MVLLVALGIWFAGALLLAAIFNLLWGWVAVPAFGAPVLSYWQAFGLILLLQLVGAFFRNPVEAK